MTDVEAAISAAWRGKSLSPYAAIVLARRVETLAAELDELRGIAAERVALWADVELLRQRLASARATIAEQAQVIARAEAVRDRTAGVHVGIPARRAARYIREG